MEKLKVNHNHTLTDIIKVGIFALFLILPILVFLPNCLYYGFNEHATNETTTEINYKYQSNEVNTLDDLVVGNIYKFNIDNTTLDTYFRWDENLLLDFDILATSNYNISNYNVSSDIDETIGTGFGVTLVSINVTYDSATFNVYLNNSNIFQYCDIGSLANENFTLNCIIRINSINNLLDYTCFTYTDYNVIESVTTNVDNTITQSVTNAWQRMWETPMLSWTNNNTFKFTINAFVNVFGITQESKMANYLTYLLVITSIYLVFDIVLTLTTKLTHLINAK